MLRLNGTALAWHLMIREHSISGKQEEKGVLLFFSELWVYHFETNLLVDTLLLKLANPGYIPVSLNPLIVNFNTKPLRAHLKDCIHPAAHVKSWPEPMTGSPSPGWWAWKLLQLLWKTAWQCLLMLHIGLPQDAVLPLQCAPRNKHTRTPKDNWENLHGFLVTAPTAHNWLSINNRTRHCCSVVIYWNTTWRWKRTNNWDKAPRGWLPEKWWWKRWRAHTLWCHLYEVAKSQNDLWQWF